jgi:hypothetical protein
MDMILLIPHELHSFKQPGRFSSQEREEESRRRMVFWS